MLTNLPSPLKALCLQHLEALKSSTHHYRMAVVSSTDGFPIAVLGADPETGRKTTAMAAALEGLSKSIGKELGLGGVDGTVLECEQGLVFCRQIRGPRFSLVLLMVVAAQGTYGQALWAIKATARELAAALAEQTAIHLDTPTKDTP